MNAMQIEALELLASAPVVDHAVISKRGLSRSVTFLASIGYAQWVFEKSKHRASGAKLTDYGRVALDLEIERKGPAK